MSNQVSENIIDSDSQNKGTDKLQTSSNFPNDQSNVQPDITSRCHQEISNIWSAIHSLFTSNLQKVSDFLSLVKHEREVNHNLNEDLRAILNKNNSLKARINNLDDTSPFTVVYDVDIAANQLNSDLKVISNWAHQWKKQFNSDKNKQAVQVIFSQKKISNCSSTCVFQCV